MSSSSQPAQSTTSSQKLVLPNSFFAPFAEKWKLSAQPILESITSPSSSLAELETALNTLYQNVEENIRENAIVVSDEQFKQQTSKRSILISILKLQVHFNNFLIFFF